MHATDLGRYRVLEPIGSGGMAVVYRGQHTLLRHQVAIKVLHPHYLSDHNMRRRFLREARIIASLRHPGIVEVFDVGTAPDGRVYVVMELLRGQPLAARLRDGRLPERTAVIFGRQLASALSVAHAHGVVHRDLKPDNVFVVSDDEVRGGERAKVLDFGVAKRVTYIRSGDRPEQTKTGVLLGTPMYMAPEQCVEAGDIDGRADLYALGIVLYQMVAGVPPFSGGGTEEIIAQQMYCEPPPACDAVPGLSPRLSAIISRCMAKDRDQRYESADALAADLSALASDDGDRDDTDVELVTGVEVVPAVGERTRPWQPVVPRRWRTGGVALAGALAGALGVMIAMRAGDARPPAEMRAGKPQVQIEVGARTDTQVAAVTPAATAPRIRAKTEAKTEARAEAEAETEADAKAARRAVAARRSERTVRGDKRAAEVTTTAAKPRRGEGQGGGRRTARGRPAPEKPPERAPANKEDPFAQVQTPALY